MDQISCKSVLELQTQLIFNELRYIMPEEQSAVLAQLCQRNGFKALNAYVNGSDPDAGILRRVDELAQRVRSQHLSKVSNK